MAGHSRTVDTGRTTRTASGRVRRVRQHLPPGKSVLAKRHKQHAGSRTVAADRIDRADDALHKLDIARDYVRSASVKYTCDEAVLVAVDALLAAGDRIYTTGTPVTENVKRHRRNRTALHREQRWQTQVLVREGRAAVRRQADAEHAT